MDKKVFTAFMEQGHEVARADKRNVVLVLAKVDLDDDQTGGGLLLSGHGMDVVQMLLKSMVENKELAQAVMMAADGFQMYQSVKGTDKDDCDCTACTVRRQREADRKTETPSEEQLAKATEAGAEVANKPLNC